VIPESCGPEADPFWSCPADRSAPASGRCWSLAWSWAGRVKDRRVADEPAGPSGVSPGTGVGAEHVGQRGPHASLAYLGLLRLT
jgi:hypothetical protein